MAGGAFQKDERQSIFLKNRKLIDLKIVYETQKAQRISVLCA